MVARKTGPAVKPDITKKAVAPKNVSGSTVTVACKIPQGLVLRVFKMVDQFEPILGGGQRKFEQAMAYGEVVEINGPAREFGRDARAPISNGFALTFGVPKDFWDLWASQNASLPAVKEGLVFAHSKTESATGMAKDREDLITGLEPLEQDGDKRLSRRLKKAERTSA